MKTQLEYLVCKSIDCTQIDRSRLVDLVQSLTEGEIERTAEIIRYLQRDFEPSELPKTIEHKRYPNACFKEYNIYKDRVIFTYTSVRTRYYKEQADAEKFAKTGNSTWSYSDQKSDEYPFEAVHSATVVDEMRKTDWINYSKSCTSI